MQVIPDQIRAARALLRLDQDEVARRADISRVTLRRLEAPDGLSKVAPGTIAQVRHVLEEAGAEFIAHGVRFRVSDAVEVEARYRKAQAAAERIAERLRGCPPFTEDDLYDEQGLPA